MSSFKFLNYINVNNINTSHTQSPQSTSQSQGRKKDSLWNVGSGGEWKDHYFSPYVDLAGWTQSGTAGVPDISEVYMNGSGSKYWNFAFIDYEIGTKTWCWGGFHQYTHGTGDGHEAQIESEMREIRAKGGDVTVSFGGNTQATLQAIAPWMTSSEDELVTMYEEIINGYGLTRIDIDTETNNEVLSNNITNAKALKRVQDDTGVEVTLTLPTLNSGLDGTGYSILNAYLDAGVDLSFVNIMAMLLGGDEGQQSISAAEGFKKQLQQVYASHGITLTDEQAYEKIGTTNSIGHEGNFFFTLPNATDVTNYSIDKDIGEVSYWVAGRDSGDAAGSTENNWAYSQIYRGFKDHDDSGGTDTTPPTTPSGIVKDGDSTEDSISVKWTPSTDDGSGVKDYTLDIKDTATGGSTYSETFTSISPNYKFENLQASTSYDIKILASDNAGNSSSYSSTVSFSTAAKPNLPPLEISSLTQKTGTEATDSLTLEWPETSDPDGDNFHYMIQKDSDASININSDLEYKFTGLQPDQTYSISVWAVDVLGNESTKKTESFKTEAEVNHPPYDILSMNIKQGTESTDSLTLEWPPTTDPDGDSFHYMIQKDSDAAVRIESSSPTEHKFDNLTAGQTYTITIWAVDDKGGESGKLAKDFTTEADINHPPADISTLEIKAGTESSDSLTMTWSPSTDPDGDEFNYMIQLDGNAPQQLPSTDTEHIFTGLEESHDYKITIWAVDIKGAESSKKEGTFTTESEINQPPSDISAFRPKTETETTIELNWNQSTDPEGDTIVYVLTIDKPGTGEFIVDQPTDIFEVLDYTFSDLNPGTTYNISILARDDKGAESNTESIQVSTKPKNHPPTDLSGLATTSKDDTSISISWNNSTDPDGDNVKYEINVDGSWVAEVMSLSYNITGLTASTTYTIEVIPTDIHNLPGVSQTITEETEDTPVINNPPTDVEESSFIQTSGTKYTTSLTLEWSASTDPDSGDTVSYVLTIDKGPDFGSEIKVSDLTYKFENLTQDTTYSIEIWAVDNHDLASENKTTKSFTTEVEEVNNPPTDVEESTFVQTSGTEDTNSLTLKWNATRDPDSGDTVSKVLRIDNRPDQGIEKKTSRLNYKFENLDQNTTYSIEIWAIDSQGLESINHTTKSFTTEVQEVNNPPTDVEASTFVQTSGTEDMNSLTLEWSASTDPDPSDTVSYVIKIDKGPDQGIEKKTSSLNYKFENLTQDTTYSIEIWAVDNHDLASENKTTKSFTTEAEEVNNPPSDVEESTFVQTSGTEDTNSLTLEWSASTDPDGDTVSYILTIDSGSEIKVSALTYKFKNLTQDTTYSIEIWAIDSQGLESTNHTTKSFTTEKSSGGDNPPSDINLNSFVKVDKEKSLTSLTLQWEPSIDVDTGDSVTYIIKIDGGPDSGREIETTQTTYSFEGLDENTKYEVELWSKSKNGQTSNHINKKFLTDRKEQEYKNSKKIIIASSATLAILAILLIILAIV